MDNKKVLMFLFTIVLGMLVANMFKEVCGCKNLIEGQVTINSQGCIRVARTQPIGLVNGVIPMCDANIDQAGWCQDGGANTNCTNSTINTLSTPDMAASWCRDNCGADSYTSNESNCNLCCQTPEASDGGH